MAASRFGARAVARASEDASGDQPGQSLKPEYRLVKLNVHQLVLCDVEEDLAADLGEHLKLAVAVDQGPALATVFRLCFSYPAVVFERGGFSGHAVSRIPAGFTRLPGDAGTHPYLVRSSSRNVRSRLPCGGLAPGARIELAHLGFGDRCSPTELAGILRINNWDI